MTGRGDGMSAGIGAAAVVAAVLVRTVVAIDPMPVWSMDPLSMWVPPAGLGPVALLMLDIVGILGAALLLVAVRLRVRTVPLALLLIGAAGVALHAARSPADAEIGMPWVFAAAGGFALAHLPRESLWRSVALASFLAIAVMLVGRGVLQVFVEHPQTIASYEATRASFLESQGWSVDSVMTRNYERRLYQAEASGWFGLANVYGSIMAAMTLALGVMGVVALRDKSSDRRVPVVLLVAAGLCAAGLALSGSKGAAGAAMLVLGAVLLAATRPSRGRLVIGLVPVVVLLGVVARGLVGERIEELSILFRWFYMQGATRIFLDHPLTGVGPAGFKDAYLLAKPPTSPEEVTSAHNLLFDWLATLGAFGIAWIGLFALACRGVGGEAAAAGAVIPESPSEGAEHPAAWDERSAILAASAIVAAVIGASAYLERALLTPEFGVLRAFGLLGGLAVAASVVRATREHPRAVSLGSVAAAAALLGHMQIEVTGVWAASAPLAACLVGLAVAPPGTRGRGSVGIAGAAALIAVVVVVAATSGRTIQRWAATLGRATDAVEPIGTQISILQTAEPGSPELLDAVRSIGLLTGQPMASTNDELWAQIHDARTDATEVALPHLLAAATIRPEHAPTRQQLVRMLLRRAEAAEGPERDARLDEACAAARAGAEAAPDHAGSWRLLASALTAAANAGPDARRRTRLQQAYDAQRTAAELDPFGLPTSLNLVDLADRLGLEDDRRAWAARALAIDSDLRLDPLKQLTETERARLERLTSGP